MSEEPPALPIKPFQPYVKLFCKILESSIWREDATTRIVWITLLAMKDMHGFVMSPVDIIAERARVSLEDAKRALQVLSSPDPLSSTKAHEGRRILPYEDGWYVVTHEKYKKLMTDEKRRAYKAAWMRERRAKQRDARGPTNTIGEALEEGKLKSKLSKECVELDSSMEEDKL